ncbi:MAG TPA: Cj0069 family protein [Candidatus Binatia bacterium]
MAQNSDVRLAILSPGDRAARQNTRGETSRFADLFREFAVRGIHVEAAIYHDDFCEEVREQLMRVDGILVWVNPIEGGRNRSMLDSMLRDVAAAGVFVSAHPDVILKLGTKEVVYRTRNLGWGCDTDLYASFDQMVQKLPLRLATGRARVLKQHRGNGGNGVWKVQLARDELADRTGAASAALPQPETVIQVRHALRGCSEEEIKLGDFYHRCAPYFYANGPMIDQEYQERLAEGMIRCYLVHDKVVGFGHQAINALFPAPPGAPSTEAPPPGPRLYHPPSMPEFQPLKVKLEQEWVPAAQRLLDIETEDLPILWDCDFLLGSKRDSGEDRYVLCEINVSSVAPYPESAVPYIVDATVARLRATRQRR